MANLTRVLLLGLILLGACARSREVQKLLPLPNRISKTHLAGTFLFLKSVVEVKSPGSNFQSFAPGQHLESDKLVQFVVRENQVDVVSIDPLYKTESTAPLNRTLASFTSRSVDVVRKRTADGDETHEEEENEQRKQWNEREFVRLDLLHDLADPIEKTTNASSFSLPLVVDERMGALNFTVERLLADGTNLSIRYSFLRYRPNPTYVQRLYPIEAQVQFGYFKTTTYLMNAFDQFTESTRQVFMDRWDTTKSIVYYFAPGFPEHLKPSIREAYNDWAQSMKVAVGDSVLEPIRENTGQQLGDLRYNLIVYDDSDHSNHGILGYAPMVTNPRTGEILKADVVLYGRVLKRAIFQEMLWDKARRSGLTETPGPALPLKDTVTQLREPLLNDLSSRITRINDAVVKSALEAARGLHGATDLEAQVFAGIFTHEFGHTLGLRHNFMGTADTHRISTGQTSTSIMGYSFLQGTETEVGSYDQAAIAFAYSPNTERREEALRANFYFCTDEDIYSSRSPLCQMYDSGTSLTELVERQLERYLSFYEVNNLRLERVDFGEDSVSYHNRIMSLLLPIRQAYDNAQAILQASAASDYASIWALARQRVETRGEPPLSNRITATVLAGYELQIGPNGPYSKPKYLERHLDATRISSLVRDARLAKNAAVAALRRVILDSARPDFDAHDAVSGKLQVRGVLQDKTLALSLIVSPTEHPLISGKLLSPYSVSEKTVPQLFASLLSNTSEVIDPEGGTEPYYRIRQYDMGLRKHALKLLTDEVALLGRHPEARELIHVQQVRRRDRHNAAEWEKYNSSRLEFQEFYRTLMLDEIARSNLANETGQDFSFAELSPFEQARNKFEFAYTPVDDEVLMTAPVSVEIDGIKTASGLLIRNNLNVAEDYFEAMSKTSRQMQEEIFRAGRGEGISLVMAVAGLDKRRDALRRYITGEQLFLKEMYLSYTKDINF
jgi:hypothetical protein